MNELKNYLRHVDLSKLRNTLLEVSIRDASNNPELYKKSEIQEELLSIHHILEKLSPFANEE